MHTLLVLLALAQPVPQPIAQQQVLSSRGLAEVCMLGTKRRGVPLVLRFDVLRAGKRTANATVTDRDPRAVFAVCADVAGQTGDLVQVFVTSPAAPKFNALILHSKGSNARPGEDVEL